MYMNSKATSVRGMASVLEVDPPQSDAAGATCQTVAAIFNALQMLNSSCVDIAEMCRFQMFTQNEGVTLPAE